MKIKEAIDYITDELKAADLLAIYPEVYEDFIGYMAQGYGPEAAAESALWDWEVDTQNDLS